MNFKDCCTPRTRWSLAVLVAVCIHAPAWAQSVPLGTPDGATPARPSPDAPSPEPRSAPALVKEGNALLRSNQAAEALQLYDRAKQQQPDAREIAFVEGLGHYQLGDYEKARAAFYEAAAADNSALANDGLYSVATCDHAEALAAESDPKLAMSKLESAMQNYQEVLARDPRHVAARESNLKAATMWRQIKQQLEQQEKQECDNPSEQQDQENKDEEQERKESESRNQKDQQNQDQQQQDQQQQDQEQEQQQDQQQSQERQQSEPQDQDSQQQASEQQQSSSADQQQQEQQEQQAAQQQMQEEQISREQAQRQLREMVQAMKDRAKQRREPVAPVRVKPVDKDW